ncbi:MAG: HEAT repeat domain-containing protein [Phycisphaerales bacterium]|nr:HEAT repeat domain-containing protein [Phycisphaerales bacterium]
MQPLHRTALLTGLFLVGSSGPLLAQSGTIQRPVVQTARVRTTVSAPASIAAPPMPSQQSTRAFIIAKRAFDKDIKKIRGKFLGSKEFAPTRQRGLEELARFTDPAAIEPLIDLARIEKQDVRDWLFEHLAERVKPEVGQATLAWMAIHDQNADMRAAAKTHLKGPASPVTQKVVVQALESPNMDIVSAGAGAAGALQLAQAIPHLIVAQAPAPSMIGTGDLAFIQVGQQRYLVTDLQPVVGDNSAGLDPTLTAVTEGTVVRIMDAVVEFYNMDAHNALVNIVEEDFGQPVDFGFDVPRWKQWYEEEYQPFVRARAARGGAGEAPSADPSR